MASASRQKEALRIALFAFIAGAHHVTEEVEKTQSLTAAGSTKDGTEMRHAMLEADYARLRESTQPLEMFTDILDEEGLYPFGAEWPREALAMLSEKVVPPKLSIDEGESDLRFRFKKGFKLLLKEIASSIESSETHRSTLDHWLVLLLNTSFHGGAVVAARNAESPKLYYDVISQIEEETDPWMRYPQLEDLLEKQLRSRLF
ncbi:MAG: hypothetical protein HY074_11050 [Deltaproteobacteria bacterium]|nr:hypothetical protein [Deltaproteobacteria bacterium]